VCFTVYILVLAVRGWILRFGIEHCASRGLKVGIYLLEHFSLRYGKIHPLDGGDMRGESNSDFSIVFSNYLPYH